MKAFYQDFRLGILGGGQLGRMLIQSCVNFNIHTCVLDPDPAAPCQGLANEFQQGSIRDFETVYRFGKQVDMLTIEIENVNVEALFRLEQEGLTIYPQPRVIAIIQDKRLQKQFYRDHGIPTADFMLVDNRAAVQQQAAYLPAFNKLGKGGYDGGGVRRLDGPQDLGNAFDEPGILEKSIDFEREISVIAARGSSGEIVVFPAVECIFHPRYNLVDYLLSPSAASAAVQDRAQAIARQVAQSLEIVGLLAVEMFVTRTGDVLVNEVAPRPHNSGHQTINANHTSQYEQHLRAILGLPLGATGIKAAAAMVNLLGEEGHTGLARYTGLRELLSIEGANLFLYGKKHTRPRRKMGHITILDDDIASLREKVQQVKKVIKVLT
ncbi:MAG: 5-(carboxyamino)imidazole ribonucleotide synthase [Pseudomonadales bacterium]|nr:5-(carboxyamino)imidazole ribonucleotide synthase [Pseudomonadales bacterium]